MADEFVIKNGFYAQGDSELTGSFTIFSTLPQPTSSFLRLVSGSINLVNFRYDANYLTQNTIIGSDTAIFPTAQLQVKGSGTTSATEALRVTNTNDTALLKVLNNGGVIQGQNNSATGNYSHAEGSSTQAIGDYSHAEGLSTIAIDSHQHVQGQYNLPISGAGAFIVGNGNYPTLSNLIFASGSSVQVTGSMDVNGSITINNTNLQSLSIAYAIALG